MSRATKKFHDNESTHILCNFWTSTHRGKLPPSRLAAPSCLTQIDVVLRRLRAKLTYHHTNDACTRSLAGHGYRALRTGGARTHWTINNFFFSTLLCKTPPSLASFKSRLVLPSLPTVVKRPLNGCRSSSMVVLRYGAIQSMMARIFCNTVIKISLFFILSKNEKGIVRWRV